MPNFRILVEYNGSFFHGWQVQTGFVTVQGELQRVLSMILKEPIHHVQGSGRTDSGVHARGQVANFTCSSIPDFAMLKRAVGAVLAPALAIREIEIVPDSFHAQRSAKRKQYTYSIWNERTPPVLEYGKVWHVPQPLDVARMQAAAQELVGTHDFTSLRAASCTAPKTEKMLFESEIHVDGPIIRYRVVGNGFLKHMVRNIAGTLVKMGKGHMGETSMQEILAKRDRTEAGMTAPAHGLCLDWVSYEDDA